jgi:tetratricopeptide (TPR) repeat protein
MMKRHLLLTFVCFCIVTPYLLSQAKVTAGKPSVATTQAPIPEEARKHFVMGTTLFKDAKTPDDYAQVEGQFKQAVDLAPQWPDARYNLALAKEAAGDYSGANADLKLYLQFKLPDAEARTAQDKIYALEAKQQKVVADAASNAAAAERRAREQQQQFIGRWDDGNNYGGRGNFISISGPYSASLSAGFFMTGNGNPDVRVDGNTALSNFRITGRNVEFTATTNEVWHIKYGRQRYDQNRGTVRDFTLSLSEDARSLTGTFRDQSSADGTDFPPRTVECTFSRHD